MSQVAYSLCMASCDGFAAVTSSWLLTILAVAFGGLVTYIFQVAKPGSKRYKIVESTRQAAVKVFAPKTREVRIFLEGAFDLMHFGHANAFRQAKCHLFPGCNVTVVVGVNSSETIEAAKGCPPLMTDEQRQTCVQGCRFVDEVVNETPYVMTPEYLKEIIATKSIDYIVHGDDPCIVDGKDVYEHVKKIGKFVTVPRTEGVSTTDIIGRMLLCTKLHHIDWDETSAKRNRRNSLGSDTNDSEGDLRISASQLRARKQEFYDNTSSKMHTTSSLLRSFSAGMKPPTSKSRVVYIDGAWDMFHPNHVKVLEKARSMGDYLLVGVFCDSLVNKYRGINFPIMNMNERLLSVLGCKWVDDVLIDAPFEIDEKMIKSLNICVVLSGKSKSDQYTLKPEQGKPKRNFAVAKKLGIFQELILGDAEFEELTTSGLLLQINKNREQFQSKFTRKKKSEDQYYQERYKGAQKP